MVWQVRYRNTVGSWSALWNISAPNNDIIIMRTSTHSKAQLVDGSLARIHPSTKSNFEELELGWDFISASNALLTQPTGGTTLISAVESGYALQFKTHTLNSGKVQYLYGYIVNMPQVYKLGMYPAQSGQSETFYDVKVQFDLITLTSTSGTP